MHVLILYILVFFRSRIIADRSKPTNWLCFCKMITISSLDIHYGNEIQHITTYFSSQLYGERSRKCKKAIDLLDPKYLSDNTFDLVSDCCIIFFLILTVISHTWIIFMYLHILLLGFQLWLYHTPLITSCQIFHDLCLSKGAW